MAKGRVSIDLDLGVVQEAIHAEVAPAVRQVLAQHYDIPDMVARELLREGPAGKEVGLPMGYWMLRDTSDIPAISGRKFIEQTIRSVIREAAREYIGQMMKDRSGALEAAFRRMMKDSPDRLVNAFVGMIEGADLDLEIEAKVKLTDADDDD